MTDIESRTALNAQDLDAAIEHARAALAALLRFPANGDGSGYPKVVAEARALLGTLLEHRLAVAGAQRQERDQAVVAATRADRNEAIAVNAALLYWLPVDDPAWPDVAMTVGRLSYDRYSDAWPDAEPPDPDDLDAACDLLLRAVRNHDADERTTLYLVLALRDREQLMACPADSSALMTWGERLLSFPGAGGLGPASLPEVLERELRTRAESLAQVGSSDPWGPRSLLLTGSPKVVGIKPRGGCDFGSCPDRHSLRGCRCPHLASVPCRCLRTTASSSWPNPTLPLCRYRPGMAVDR